MAHACLSTHYRVLRNKVVATTAQASGTHSCVASHRRRDFDSPHGLFEWWLDIVIMP